MNTFGLIDDAWESDRARGAGSSASSFGELVNPSTGSHDELRDADGRVLERHERAAAVDADADAADQTREPAESWLPRARSDP